MSDQEEKMLASFQTQLKQMESGKMSVQTKVGGVFVDDTPNHMEWIKNWVIYLEQKHKAKS
ncbi:MAG TPA: hypothetical protein DD400_02750 [Rhodospirillaceae bacterium]|nr:hypothetical protein [Rhodospirillaceae bacterium]